MEYTPLVLGLLGVGGILLHNLMKMDELNKKLKGKFSLSSYLALERFSIILSVILVVICVTVSQEVKQLEAVGKWLGLAFVAIGYMSQSIILKFSSKAESKLKP
jgi:hypothetical protein